MCLEPRAYRVADAKLRVAEAHSGDIQYWKGYAEKNSIYPKPTNAEQGSVAIIVTKKGCAYIFQSLKQTKDR